jgi:hypothetical protein
MPQQVPRLVKSADSALWYHAREGCLAEPRIRRGPLLKKKNADRSLLNFLDGCDFDFFAVWLLLPLILEEYSSPSLLWHQDIASETAFFLCPRSKWKVLSLVPIDSCSIFQILTECLPLICSEIAPVELESIRPSSISSSTSPCAPPPSPPPPSLLSYPRPFRPTMAGSRKHSIRPIPAGPDALPSNPSVAMLHQVIARHQLHRLQGERVVLQLVANDQRRHLGVRGDGSLHPPGPHRPADLSRVRGEPD